MLDLTPQSSPAVAAVLALIEFIVLGNFLYEREEDLYGMERELNELSSNTTTNTEM